MRIIGLIKKHGLAGLAVKWLEKKSEPVDLEYRRNYQQFLPDEASLQRERQECSSFSYTPKISIVVPAYHTREKFLRELIDSVKQQSYDNWELCIVDAGEEETGLTLVGTIVQDAGKEDARIRYQHLPENRGISGNTNAGFQMAEGAYVALLDHDDVLSPNALYEVVKCLQNPFRPLLIYSDEDKTNAELNTFFEPHFKPDYNEELLNHYNYICHFLVFSKELAQVQEGLRSEYDGAQDYDFVLRCTEHLQEAQIAHIPRILYHWRVHQESTAGNSASKNYAYEAGLRAVQAHMDRLYDVGGKLKVMEASVRRPEVIATKGQEYVSVIRPYEQNASEYLVYLASDCTPKQKGWQRQLASYLGSRQISGAITESGHAPVGMAGGKIITAGPFWAARVVSCGYTFREDGTVLPLFEGLWAMKKGYYRRAVVAQDVSACSLDFCVISREAYEQVGGIDEQLPKPYRDMDFAFRLRKAGYRVILDAGVTAVQKKQAAASRILLSQKAEWMKTWSEYFSQGDPFYHADFRKIIRE